jgi:hypothetical protein
VYRGLRGQTRKQKENDGKYKQDTFLDVSKLGYTCELGIIKKPAADGQRAGA